MVELLPKRTKYSGPCLVEGCNAAAKYRGICNPHYHRLKKRGTTGLYKYSVQDRIEEFYKTYTVDRKTGCHNWCGHTNVYGYGLFSIHNKQQMTHRLAWEFKHGPIPPGMCICHKCDNRKCVNVEHLFIGTRDDNNKDMARKGRHVGAAKLTKAQVRYIFKSKVHYKILAKRFSISTSQIFSIRNRREWRRVTDAIRN